MEEKPVLIDPEETKKIVMDLREAYIIVGGPQDQVYGTLDFQTLFVWTSEEKATDFISKNLNPGDGVFVKKSMKEILEVSRKLGFTRIRFDFQAKGSHPEQQFVNYDLKDGDILDLLMVFHSL